MLANNFDDLLRQRFEEEEPEYNPAAWTRLAARMEEKKKSPKRGIIALWPVTIGIAASVTAAACMLMPIEYPQPRTIDMARLAAVAPVIGTPIPAITPVAALPLFTILPDQAPPLFHTSPSVLASVSTSPALQSSFISTDTTSAAAALPDKAETSAYASASPSKTYLVYTEYNDADADQNSSKHIVISLAGGMQYGSLNAGYTAAINVRHDVSRRWYVDADMGYVQYNASGAQQVTFFNNAGGAAKPAAGVGAKASGTGEDPTLTTPEAVPEALPTFQSKQRPRIQYVQATPGVGFRVSTHFTVGAAVDIQRALMVKAADGEPPVQDANGKVLPLTDLGAAGRMQWHITNRLRAGLTYRRGLNTVLQGKSNYLDRNYMQLQLIVPLTKK